MLNIPDSRLGIVRSSRAALGRLNRRLSRDETKETNCSHEFASAPTVADDFNAGFHTNDRWLDTSTDDEYVCVDADNGVWKITT